MMKHFLISSLFLTAILGNPLPAQDSLKSMFSANVFFGISTLETNIGDEGYGEYGLLFAPTKNSFNTFSSVQGAMVSYQIPVLKRILLGLSGYLFFYTAEINDRVLRPQNQFPYYSAYVYNSAGAEILPGDSVIPSDKYYFRNLSLNLLVSVPLGKSKKTFVTAGVGRPNKNCIYRVQRVIYSNVDKGYTPVSALSAARLFFGSVSTRLHSWEKAKLTGKIDFIYSRKIFGGYIEFYNTGFSATFHHLYLAGLSIGVSF